MSLDLTGCANCLTAGQKQVVIINVLLEILQTLDPMADTDIETYLNGCANCLYEGQKNTVIVNLIDALGVFVSENSMLGLVDPNGVVTGLVLGQKYTQWNGVDTTLRTWTFTGTVGTNTGWI